ncbi:MAG: 50S ribosomal protein L4 [Nitrospiria bacterium]
MSEISVVNHYNEKTGVVELDDGVFGVEVNPSLLHEVVCMQRASARLGLAATKEKGLVRGGGKKPWRQKGTGRARAGSSRSPLWRGGGTVFGPSPRSYRYSMPKKKIRKALLGALSSKVHSGSLVVLDEWVFPESKTRSMVHLIKTLNIDGQILIVTAQKEDLLDRVSRNIRNIKIVEVRSLDVYGVLRSDVIVMTKREISRLVEMWGKNESL